MGLFSRSREKRASVAETNPWAIPTNAQLGSIASTGIPINETSALSVVAVYACTRILADAVSSLPLVPFKVVNGIKQAINPVPTLVQQPFYGLDVHDGLFQLVVSLALRGNAYALVVRDDNFEPINLVVLHPDWVRVTRDQKSGAAVYLVNNQPVDPEDMLHIRNFTTPGSVVGVSVIDNAAQALGLALATEDFGARFFGQGATPAGLITFEGDLNDAQAKEIAEAVQARHGGIRRSHLPLVLTGGAKWTPLAVSPENAQFLQTRQYQRSEIAMMFGVPPHLIGDVDKTTSWGTGIEEQGRSFVTYTLKPYLTRIEAAITGLLPKGMYVRFDTNDLIRGDTSARYSAYQSALMNGWLCVDEVRAAEDLPPLPDGEGQVYRHPANLADGATSEPTDDPSVDPNAGDDPGANPA